MSPAEADEAAAAGMVSPGEAEPANDEAVAEEAEAEESDANPAAQGAPSGWLGRKRAKKAARKRRFKPAAE
jgi:hypothetical protein